MAKRVDNDSTMEVSSSQLVPDAKNRPAPHRAPGQDKNDVSMWIGNVVGADAFAGTEKPKKRRGLVVLLVLIVVAAGAAAVYFLVLAKKDATPSPSAGAVPSAGSSVLAQPAPPTLDAQVMPAATPDAAPAEVAIDAGTDTGALKADAISGMPQKPATKKPPAKKPASKKVVKKPVPKKISHH